MGRAIGGFLPLALGIALSPLPVIVVILMLFSPRAKINGPAFLLGWLVGVATAAGVALALSDAASVGSEDSAGTAASWAKLALGLLLAYGAARQWRTRPAQGERPEMPAWMAGIGAFTAPKAAALAVSLAGLKPKNLILAAAAGTTIAQAGLAAGAQIGALAIFVALASLTIAIPVLYHAFGGDSAERTLDGWRAWLQQNNSAVMTLVFAILGIVLIGQAIQSLSA